MAPKGQSTRPTADRARQALFDVLEHAPWSAPIRGARVLDLFAGSGALGLEALSRGGAFCLFVDTDAAARSAIAENASTLGLTDRCRVMATDATHLPAAEDEAFDLAFLDPPYGKGRLAGALACLRSGKWLSGSAMVVVERGAGETAPATPGFEMIDERVWGAARVSFLRTA